MRDLNENLSVAFWEREQLHSADGSLAGSLGRLSEYVSLFLGEEWSAGAVTYLADVLANSQRRVPES